MKRHFRMLAVVSICVLFACVGCGTKDSEVPTEPIQFTYDPDTYATESETESLIEKYGLDILAVVCVEAGTEALTDEMFFASYSNQTLVIGKELSAEELSVSGATYSVPVTYSGYDLTIEVDVVDTTLPTIEKIDDLIAKAGGTIAYKKAVSYSDNSSNDLTLSIDNSAVDAQTPGEYTVIYTVTDAAGNSASLELTITIVEAASHTEDDVKDLALAVLDKIYDANASQYDNALALFKWVHSNIYYTHSSGDRSSVWAGAYEGLHDGRGDCYAFYATYAVLLTYAGIENECVARVSDTSNHWWNLVNTGDGWYHCDTSPRRNGDGYFCFMQTDAQVASYTKAYPEKPDYYTFDGSLLPERATTIIYGYDPDTIYAKYNTAAVEAYLAAVAANDATEEDPDVEQAEQFISEEEEEAANAVSKDGDKENTSSEDAQSTKKKKKKKKEESSTETTESTETAVTTETPELTDTTESADSTGTTETTDTTEPTDTTAPADSEQTEAPVEEATETGQPEASSEESSGEQMIQTE